MTRHDHGPDEFQRRVIAARERSIRVLAPAGSGKTETLGRRIATRIAEGIDPRRILVLTFDTNANGAFLGTLQHLGLPRRPEVRTLNAFGLKILREHFPDERQTLARGFYTPQGDLPVALVEAVDQGALLGLFGIFKSHLFDPRALDRDALETWIARHYRRLVPETFFRDYDERHARAFARDMAYEFVLYEESLAARNAIDFDDQKLRACIALRKNDAIRARVHRQYDEIVVDEFQDINALDVELIRLVSPDATLVVTGDDDQAIYEFRWASPAFLIDAGETFGREFASYELSVNYRCPRVILDHADRLVRHNRTRVPKSPRSGVEATGSIEHIAQTDRIAEANAIRHRIQQLVANHPEIAYRDIGILYRRNMQHYQVQAQLFRTSIPFSVREEHDIRIQWRLALDLLHLSTALRSGDGSSPDLLAAVRSFRPFRYVSPRQRSDLERAAREGGRFGLDVLVTAAKQTLGDYPGRRFESAIGQLAAARTIGGELEVIEREFVGTGRRKSRKAARQETGPDDSSMNELRDVLARGDSTRAGAIARLESFLDREVPAIDGDAVELTTCHGAKGRQWTIVVLPSCNEGIVPDPLMREDLGELEGERRLFYVAMTRAARHLIIGHAAEHSADPKGPAPSRFLYEAGIPDLPVKAAAPRAPGRSHLAVVGDRGASSPNSRAAFGKSGERTAAAIATAGRITFVPLGRSPIEMDAASTIAVTTLRDLVGKGPLSVHYVSPESTFALQFELMLTRVPFSIRPEDKLAYTALMRECYRDLTGKTLSKLNPGHKDPLIPAKNAIGRALREVAVHHGVTRTDPLALDNAIAWFMEPVSDVNPQVTFRLAGT